MTDAMRPVMSIRNIVIVGETGAGKSSLINLVTGEDRAVTSNDICGPVTTETEFYDWIKDTQTFRLWDTPGLCEDTCGAVFTQRKTQGVLRSLLTEMSKEDGVHLLVLCMRGPPMLTRGMKLTYETILQIRNKVTPDVPLAAIITDLEKRSASPDIIASMDTWWADNAAALSDNDMHFSAHACVTTLPDNHYPKLPGRRELCQRLVRHLIIEGVSPGPIRNIVIVGEVAAGKSSLVNLILDSEQADVTNDVGPTTITTTSYDWENGNQRFRLWDTPGLDEFQSRRRPQEALRTLIMDLNERGGVHLLVICIRGVSRIKMDMKRTHGLIIKLRDKFSPTSPVVAVTTELEKLSTTVNTLLSMEEWWRTHSGMLSDYEISFSGHACITTLPDNCHPQVPGRRKLCQELVRNLIIHQSLPVRTTPTKGLHVLLFGETGGGKSSLVNLLAGRQIASVSPGSAPCTLDASEYQFQLSSTKIHLWDTVGLQEPEMGPNGYVSTVEKAVQLIRKLNAVGGLSLFLLCIRGNRIASTTQSNYRLFYEILGMKQVPIALVVTNLEREADMEGWWERNCNLLERYGIQSAGHACITALEGHAKYAASRDILRGLLSRFDDQGKFSMPPEGWTSRLLKGMGSLVEKKDLVQILTKRCNLDPDIAQRVAACINSESR